MKDVLHLVTVILSVTFSLLETVGFIILAFLISSFNELGDFPDTYCEGEFICIFDRSSGYGLFQAFLGLLSLVVSIVSIFYPPKSARSPAYIAACYFHVAMFVGSITFFMFRLVNMGLLDFAWKDQGCKDPDVTGNPFERYERYGEKEITDISQCFFNAFDTTLITHSDTTLTSESAVQRLDWSKPDTFTQAQRGAMLAAANSVGGDYNNNTLPYYFESYYWGCSSVCTKDRYNANYMFMYLTAISILFHVAAIILNLVLGSNQTVLPKNEEGDQEEKDSLLEEGSDQTEEDEDNSATDSVEDASVGNLRLRY